MKRVIIDNDGEFDDSFALLLALKSKELKVEAITTLGGVRDIDSVTTDVLNIVELVGKEDIPVAKGIGSPFFRDMTAVRQRTDNIWKNAGKPNAKPLRTPKMKTVKEHAVDLLIKKIMDNPGEMTLVTLGALTNVAVALMKEPRIAKNVKEAYTMGGVILAPGNVTPVAEFNIWGDPDAAKIYFNSGIPITMVGLEIYYKANLTGEEWNTVKNGNAVTKYIFDNFGPWFEAIRSRRPHLKGGEEIGDALTIGVLLDKTLAKTRKAYVDVENKSEMTSGQTVGYFVDASRAPPKEPNVDLCVDVDAERFNKMFMQRVTS